MPSSLTSQYGNGAMRTAARSGSPPNELSTARTVTANRRNAVSSGKSIVVSVATVQTYRIVSGEVGDVTGRETIRKPNR